MSMTREEAIERIGEQYKVCKEFYHLSANPEKDYPGVMSYMEALGMALSALRPVRREQVERIWFREPYTRLGTKYGENGDIVYSAVNTCMACGHETPIGHFCHNCGAALDHMGVQMVVERLEALHEISPST